MDDVRFLLVSRALQSMEAECVIVGRNAGDWQFVDWLTGSGVPAGSIVKWKQFLVSDRPARVDQPRSRNEINRVEPHAKTAPKIGGSAELAGDCDVHVIMNFGRDNICRGKFLDVWVRCSSTGFKHQD